MSVEEKRLKLRDSVAGFAAETALHLQESLLKTTYSNDARLRHSMLQYNPHYLLNVWNVTKCVVSGDDHIRSAF